MTEEAYDAFIEVIKDEIDKDKVSTRSVNPSDAEYGSKNTIVTKERYSEIMTQHATNPIFQWLDKSCRSCGEFVTSIADYFSKSIRRVRFSNPFIEIACRTFIFVAGFVVIIPLYIVIVPVIIGLVVIAVIWICLAGIFGWYHSDSLLEVQGTKKPAKLRTITDPKQADVVPKIVSNLSVDILLQRANASAESGDVETALRTLDQAVELEPTNSEVYMRRGALKRKLKDERGAIQDINMAQLMLDRLDEGLKANDDGNAMYETGDYQNAIRNYNKAISLLPTLTSLYYWRGMAKRYMDDFSGAIEDFSSCIDANECVSNTADAYYARAQIKYHKMADSTGALQDYNKAIELKPTESDFYCSRAFLLDNQAAINDLTRAIELNPSEAKTYLCRCMRMFSFHDYNSALRDITTVIDMTPDDLDISLAEVYSLRGDIRFLLYDFPGALQDASKAIEIDPSLPKAFLGRGTIKVVMKNIEGAIVDFNNAIQLDSSCAEAHYNLGDAYLTSGSKRLALEEYKILKTLDPEMANKLFNLIYK